MARIYQSRASENRAERRMLSLLRSLPEDAHVLCELRLVRAWETRTGHLRDRQPDFVVVCPALGVVSIEVKDWNLSRGYRWLSQTEVVRDDDGKEIDNPWHQAFTYGKALEGLVGRQAWVTSLVAFPRLSSAQFWNAFSMPRIEPQGRALVDPDMTLFADQIDADPLGIVGQLEQIVRLDSRFQPASVAQCESVVRQLIPPKYVVASGQERHQQARGRLSTLTDQQQQWAFSLTPGAHSIIDLAGSGKTNVLVSRALHLVEQASDDGRAYAVLILTYSETLRRHIQLMIDQKLDGERLPARTSIDVLDVDAVLQQIVAAAYGMTGEEFAAEYPPSLRGRARSRRLLAEFAETGPSLGETCKWYDAILIDEVEDFAPVTPALVSVLHSGEELLLVGDLAQRFGDQPMDLHSLGLDTSQVRVEPRYTMYRCPPAVASLAHSFAYADPELRRELGSYGYTASPVFAGPVQSLPEFRLHRTHVEGRRNLLASVRGLLDTGLGLDDIMLVVAPTELDGVCTVLADEELPSKCRPSSDSAILVVGFEQSKGLEAPGVVLWGVDKLDCEPIGGRSATTADHRAALSRARRLVYVALTRTTHYLTVHYEDRTHPLVSELLALQPRGPEAPDR